MKNLPELYVNNDPNVSLLHSSKNPEAISVLTRDFNNKKGVGELYPYPIENLIWQTRTQDAITGIIILGIIKIGGLLINKLTPLLSKKLCSNDFDKTTEHGKEEIILSHADQLRLQEIQKDKLIENIETRDLSLNSNIDLLFNELESIYYRDYFNELKHSDDFHTNPVNYIIDILILTNMIREVRNAQFRNIYPNQVVDYKKIRKQSDDYISLKLMNNFNYMIPELNPITNTETKSVLQYILGGGYFRRNHHYYPVKQKAIFYTISQQAYNDIV